MSDHYRSLVVSVLAYILGGVHSDRFAEQLMAPTTVSRCPSSLRNQAAHYVFRAWLFSFLTRKSAFIENDFQGTHELF